MSVNLLKGQKVSLTKGNPGLSLIRASFRCDTGAINMADIDISAFLLGVSGKVMSSRDFVFYSNLSDPSGAVVLSDTSATGSGEKSAAIDLAKIPQNIMRIAFSATIYNGEARRQTFGKVRNSYIRISDAKNGRELLRFDVNERFSSETALVFGELYRNNVEWKFNAIGKGCTGGLAALCGMYGIEVG